MFERYGLCQRHCLREDLVCVCYTCSLCEDLVSMLDVSSV